MEADKIKTALIDGYLDEPSCLGVPPYISPHIRYTYGALLEGGIREENLQYFIIDKLREDWNNALEKLEEFDLVIIIAGTTVPGNYLGGEPVSLKELKEIGEKVYYPTKVLGGPITLVMDELEGIDHVCDEIASFDLYKLLSKKEIEAKPENLKKLIGRWAVRGASLTKKHPNHPRIMAELETFRGCPRSNHCSFCSERLKKYTYSRPVEDILKEVEALAQSGVHNYRLGCQTDLLKYGAREKNGNLIPEPQVFSQLYQGIRECNPELKVLHLDNMNPATLAHHPQKAKKILEIISTYNTPGDTAAFGLESADPEVLTANNIESDPELTLKAIKLMNEIGEKREEGLPTLLPGLNFLHGLKGERPETMEYNLDYLRKIKEKGLLLRRINIRQVQSFGEYEGDYLNKGRFQEYKRQVNEEINQPMLKQVFPTGTILKGVIAEQHKGKVTYGRQLGTYPILVGIPGNLELNKEYTVRIIDHGYRSITALPWPLKINEHRPEQFSYIPGISKKRADDIFINQPQNPEELKKYLPPDFKWEKWKDWFNFN